MYYNSYYDYSTNDIYTFDDESGIIKQPYSPYCWVKTAEPTEYKTITGVPVRKIPMEYAMKDNPDFYETDLNPEMRVLVDNYYDDESIAKNRIMIFDIEVSSDGGFPNMKTANKFVTSIATTILGDNTYVIFVYDKYGMFTLQSDNTKKYIVCSTEEELLKKFVVYVSKVAKPTILTGWHSFGFDIPYLYRRIRRVFSTEFANKLSPIGMIKKHTINFTLKNEIYEGYKIAGISQLDYMILYKKYSINDKPMYSLDFIAKEELGRGKVVYDGSLDDLYKSDINKYVEYNTVDIELIKELEDKLHYLDIAVAMCHKGCIPYDMVFMQSRIIEGSFFKFFKKNNIVSINKPKTKDEDKYSGAYVKEPIPGRYKWVYSCDLTSLYPSIMRTLNISTETKIGKVIDVNTLNGDVVVQFINGNEKSISGEEFDRFVKKNKIRKSASRVLYKSTSKGFICQLLEDWFNERLEYKKLKKEAQNSGDKENEKQYDVKQYVTKILLNSVYGVLGLPSFRFYDKDNAESVTTTGQEIIKFSQYIINKSYEKLGAEKGKDYVIYGDTDSIYASSMPVVPESLVLKSDGILNLTRVLANVITKTLNSGLEKFSTNTLNSDENYLSFNQEAICYSALWVKKKKYAMYILDDEGFVKLKDSGDSVPSGYKHPNVNTVVEFKSWLENNSFDVDESVVRYDSIKPKFKVKGLDTVKSDFPESFKTILKETIISILEFKEEDEILNHIKDFNSHIGSESFENIAIPKGVRNIEKYYDKQTLYKKGAPIHVKSAINYNSFLDSHDLDKSYRHIMSGEKIKYVMLHKNEYNFDTIAFKDDIIPEELEFFITKYINRDAIFNSVLRNKLQSFWEILDWGELNLKENTLLSFI